MALIKCSECGRDISDMAVSCPSCGKPNKGKAVLIEQTSKKWKIVQLIGVAFIVIGLFIFSAGYSKGGLEGFLTVLGFNMVWWGILIIIIGKIGAWWSHR
jgi:predicted phage tail protein